MTNRENNFVNLLVRLTPEQLLGVARIMGINLVDEEKRAIKDGEVILDEMFKKFSSYSKERQKNLLKIMRKAAKK